MKSYYTLEKHLRAISLVNKEYEVLNSTWCLNQESVPKALGNINFSFPHYSLHDKSHSETIIRNIESFLGEERIKNLSPSDTWLILMSAYTHDLGMVILNKSLEEKWAEKSFEEYLKKLSASRHDNNLADSAKLLLKFRQIADNKISLEQEVSPIQVRRALILVTADYFRRIHHIRSQEILNGKDHEFRSLLSNFYSDLIPNRFIEILGEIAYSHGASFDFILNKLDYEANGIANDKIHPRFISCMLKLGDLLDVDDKRFDSFSEKVLDNALPTTSLIHKQKHSSIKHLLINPTAIEITIDCKNQSVYRIARQWFDWLEDEVQNQSKEWTHLAPDDLTGLPPTITNGKIKVLFNGSEPERELLDLRFSIKPEKAIEIFEGGGIYDKAGFVFLREIVQNAIDASKIQLWKDIRRGLYDAVLIEYLNEFGISLDENSSTEIIISNIKFPYHIPVSILKNYQVDLVIEWKNELRETLQVAIKDKGCGISKKDLLRMTNRVGESRSNDRDYQSLKVSMPYWLKPTGAFGIGIQSIFLVADSFTMQTKSENDPAMEIIFNSSKYGEYSYITSNVPNISRGTAVTIDIQKESFRDIFENSFSMDIVDKYDYFTDDESIYVYKMEHYLKDELAKVEELNIYMPGKRNVKKSTYKKKQSEFLKPIKRVTSGDKTLDVALFDVNKELAFFIEENLCIGSQVTINVSYWVDKSSQGFLHKLSFNELYQVRDIPVKDNQSSFYALPYFSISWNLLNPDSDRILNIARNKLIEKTQDNHNNLFISEIMPKAIAEMWLCLIQIEKFELREAFTALHLQITCLINSWQIQGSANYGDLTLPNSLIYRNDLNDKLKFVDFFNVDSFMIVHPNKSYPKPEDEIAFFEKYRDKFKEYGTKEGISVTVTKYEYLKSYLITQYQLVKLSSYDTDSSDHFSFFIFNKRKPTVVDYIECDEDARKRFIKGILPQTKRGTERRYRIYPVSPYSQILGVFNKWTPGFDFFPDYSEYSIIGPFKNPSEVDELKKRIKDVLETGDKDKISQRILSKEIEKLIPKKMVSWIIDNSARPERKVTKEMILSAYSDMIAEAILL